MMQWLAPILLLAADLSIAQDRSAAEWRKIGLGHISRGELKPATSALEKACELEEKPGDSCYFLGRNLHALGEFEAARKAFDLALRAAPPAIQSRVYRAAALNYSALGMEREAERDLRQAVALGPSGTEDARVDLGAFLFRQGRLEEASKLLEAAVQGNPKSARANLEHGRVLLQLDRLEAAVARLEKAVSLNPTDWNAHLLLGRAYQRLGRDADAARELEAGRRGWEQRQNGAR